MSTRSLQKAAGKQNSERMAVSHSHNFLPSVGVGTKKSILKESKPPMLFVNDL